MRKIMTIALLFLSSLSFAQQLNNNVKEAFKADDAAALLAEVKAQKASINEYFDVEGLSYTLLAISIKMNRPNIFNALLEQKADLNKICSDKTPLMYTAKYNTVEFAKALLKAGADVDVKNSEGRTALDYAVKYKNSELENLLKSVKK